MECYKATGASGYTYAIHKDGTTWMQIEYPHGELGRIIKLSSDNWDLERWRRQSRAATIELEKIPQELQYTARERTN